MPDLSRIGEREKLKPGDEPHWQRLRQGVYLGYRPSKKKAGGTWFARCYDAETNRNSRKRLRVPITGLAAIWGLQEKAALQLTTQHRT